MVDESPKSESTDDGTRALGSPEPIGTPPPGPTTARESELFTELVDLDATCRAPRLQELTERDPELGERVRTLFRWHDDGQELTTPEGGRHPGPEVGWTELLIGFDLGAYVIRRLLGRGGMGAVFEAEQKQPDRRVALKFLSGQFGTDGAWQRFDREIRVQGSLQHPGIARVFDAGTSRTPVGTLPWYAMEYVEGPSLDVYCSRSTSSSEDRASLIALVADAVAHAHDRGVVHRDLKPANILVDLGTRVPQPKVLDFGIAKAVAATATENSLRTEAGQVIGTIHYMSPEQVEGRVELVDARTDVYALGVIAYELLLDRRPYELAGLPFAEIVRRIRDVIPESPRAIRRGFPKDLACVVMKALEKEPARRYADAGAFAADLRRALRAEPIAARPPTAAYRIGRLVRRNRSLAAGIAMTLLVLVVGLVATNAARVDAVLARESADAQRDRAETLAEEARFNAYAAQITAADVALELGYVATAEQRLAACPEDLRGWEWRNLRGRLDGSLRRIDDGACSGLTTSADGTRLAWISSGSSLVVLDRDGETWTRRFAVPVQSRYVRDAVFGSDRNSVLTVDRFGSGATVFDAATGELRRRFFGHPAETRVAVLSPGGELLATASRDGSVRLWVVDSGELRSETRAYPNVSALAFAPDASELVAFSGDGVVRLAVPGLSVASRRELPLRGPSHAAVSPSLTIVAVANDAGAFLVALDREEPPDRLGHEDTETVAFDADGRRVACGLRSGLIEVFDTASRSRIARLRGHRSSVTGMAFDPATPGRLYSCANDGVLEWDVDCPSPTLEVGAHLRDCAVAAVSDDGRTVCTKDGRDSTLRVFDIETGAGRAVFFPGDDIAHALDRTGSRLAFAEQGGTIWLATIPPRAEPTRLAALEQDVAALAFAPTGGSLVAVMARDGEILEINVPTGAVRPLRAGREVGRVLAAAVDIERRRALLLRRSGPDEGLDEIVSFASVEPARILGRGRGHDAPYAQFSADGRLALTYVRDAAVKLYDVPSGRVVFERDAEHVISATLAPDGSRLALGYDDGRIHLLDVARGLELGTLSGTRDWAASLAFTPDGERLLATWPNGTLRIFDSRSVAERAKRRVGARATTSAAESLLATLRRGHGDDAAIRSALLVTDPGEDGIRDRALELLSMADGTPERLIERALRTVSQDGLPRSAYWAARSMSNAVVMVGLPSARAYVALAAAHLMTGAPTSAPDFLAAAESLRSENHDEDALIEYWGVRVFLEVRAKRRMEDALEALRELAEQSAPGSEVRRLLLDAERRVERRH